MNIDQIFSDPKKLEKEIQFFKEKNQIKIIKDNLELILAHIKKARHNAGFFKLNKEHQEYNDWLIVTLYYALYHASLALITNKGFTSKNHHATILILIKEYRISQREAELIEELSLSKDDAELYTNLKSDRHDASYSTRTKFTKEVIEDYETKVLDFINKAEEIITKQ